MTSTTRRRLLAGVSAIGAAAISRPAFAALPGGHYLTPSSNDDPLVSADLTSSTLYSTPLLGESNATTVFDGTTFSIRHSNRMALALSSSVHLADNIYPIFAGLIGGAPAIASGPAWQSVGYGTYTVGAAAAVVRDAVSGLLVNAASPTTTLFNGGFFTAAPGSWRLVGGIRPRANGVIGIDKSAGLNRRCDAWNLNNQQRIKLVVTENGFFDTATNPPTWHWYTSQIAPRYLNGNANCHADIFTMFDRRAEVDYLQCFFPGGPPNGVNYDIGLRLNSEVSVSGAQRWRGFIAAAGRWDSHSVSCRATMEGLAGVNQVAPCETVESLMPGYSTGAAEVFGQELGCRCTIEYDG